ncbi:MAG: hypothetical protein PVH61_23105 [Candidatus Aminicenantes bacterium]|jgi:hypothetical protein
MSRPKVTKIQVWVDGKGPIDIDADNIDALFLTDQAVRNFLAPFYTTGAGADKGIDPISKWSTITTSGTLPAYLIKVPDCTLK